MGRSSSSSSRIALWTILFAVSPLLASAGDNQYGIDMFGKAARGACWVEKLHKLPPIDVQGVHFGDCYSNMRFDNEWKEQTDFHSNNLKKDGYNPAEMKDTIETWAMSDVKEKLEKRFTLLPSVYGSTCKQFVENENQNPAHDYSSILQDTSKGVYPFKGLAHCMLGVIEQNNGAAELAALKSHWLSPKTFQQAIIDRENENRARHGVPALKLDSELNTRAQRYAEELARICQMVHMAKNPKYGETHLDLQYDGGMTGENLAEFGSLIPTDIDRGVFAANEWYSEIKDYPWPQFTGNNANGVIGHFTASVWKSTKLAGYGVARNEACPRTKVFVVARYSPGGNIKDEGMTFYKDNVLPPL
ncbi:unnamed protein product [Orchesella dallaii]|uniref:SCP domain-containing protein n=1 Tax=Orchesella dallaii TaxID=48710 RepID=A0ABP1PLJ8_9HEXA